MTLVGLGVSRPGTTSRKATGTVAQPEPPARTRSLVPLVSARTASTKRAALPQPGKSLIGKFALVKPTQRSERANAVVLQPEEKAAEQFADEESDELARAEPAYSEAA